MWLILAIALAVVVVIGWLLTLGSLNPKDRWIGKDGGQGGPPPF